MRDVTASRNSADVRLIHLPASAIAVAVLQLELLKLLAKFSTARHRRHRAFKDELHGRLPLGLLAPYTLFILLLSAHTKKSVHLRAVLPGRDGVTLKYQRVDHQMTHSMLQILIFF